MSNQQEGDDLLSEAQKSSLKQLIEEKEKAIREKRSELEKLSSSRPMKLVGINTREDLLSQVMEQVASLSTSKQEIGSPAGLGSKGVANNTSKKKMMPTRLSKIRSDSKRHTLSASSIAECSVIPQAPIFFEKTAQTDYEAVTKLTEIEDVAKGKIKKHPTVTRPTTTKEKFRRIVDYLHQETLLESLPPQSPNILTERQQELATKTAEFGEACEKAVKMIDRALGTSEIARILPDFEEHLIDSGGEGQIGSIHLFSDAKLTLRRPVVDIRTSSILPELFIAGYGSQQSAGIHDPGGVILLWSIVAQEPEATFISQSPICSCILDPFRPAIVFAGTYSGGILVYDSRAKSKPVQRTPLLGSSHNHGIYSMQIVGTQHASNLVSADSDGRVCRWSVNMLHTPAELIDLRKGTRDLGVMCAGMPEGETNVLYGGSENGALFVTRLIGSKAGILDTNEAAHAGPCTSLSWHPVIENQPYDFSDVLITTSMDWTSKMWVPKLSLKNSVSFEGNDDYVLHSAWSPTHPAVFITGDAEGYLDIWNLCSDQEISISHYNTGLSSLNKVAFTNDGRKVLAADLNGGVKLLGITPELTTPSNEEWNSFNGIITQLREKT